MAPILHAPLRNSHNWHSGSPRALLIDGIKKLLPTDLLVFLALSLLVFVTKVKKPTPKEEESMHAEEPAGAGGH